MENSPSLGRQLLNKVPEITLYFWIIKILCTTVGETAADFLNTKLGLGLNGTSLVMGSLLIVVLFFQFKTRRYTPSLYWLAVVLISIFGTLLTDNLTDNLNISRIPITIIFSVVLAAIFAIWYAVEKTLSMHTIYTFRREAFYWFAILFTFALGTAAGDLMAETLNLGYLNSVGIFGGAIAVIYLLYLGYKKLTGGHSKNASSFGWLTFWLVYILTRPLGASIGDYLSQAQSDGGLGLGTVVTSAIFLVAILATVVYLSITKKDASTLPSTQA